MARSKFAQALAGVGKFASRIHDKNLPATSSATSSPSTPPPFSLQGISLTPFFCTSLLSQLALQEEKNLFLTADHRRRYKQLRKQLPQQRQDLEQKIQREDKELRDLYHDVCSEEAVAFHNEFYERLNRGKEEGLIEENMPDPVAPPSKLAVGLSGSASGYALSPVLRPKRVGKGRKKQVVPLPSLAHLGEDSQYVSIRTYFETYPEKSVQWTCTDFYDRLEMMDKNLVQLLEFRHLWDLCDLYWDFFESTSKLRMQIMKDMKGIVEESRRDKYSQRQAMCEKMQEKTLFDQGLLGYDVPETPWSPESASERKFEQWKTLKSIMEYFESNEWTWPEFYCPGDRTIEQYFESHGVFESPEPLEESGSCDLTESLSKNSKVGIPGRKDDLDTGKPDAVADEPRKADIPQVPCESKSTLTIVLEAKNTDVFSGHERNTAEDSVPPVAEAVMHGAAIATPTSFFGERRPGACYFYEDIRVSTLIPGSYPLSPLLLPKRVSRLKRPAPTEYVPDEDSPSEASGEIDDKCTSATEPQVYPRNPNTQKLKAQFGDDDIDWGFAFNWDVPILPIGKGGWVRERSLMRA